MEKYIPLRRIGEGSFGAVWQAVNDRTGEIVAIKKLKREYSCWEDCLHLPEVKALSKLKHPNIIKLKELVGRDGFLYFIFDYMDRNLDQIIQDRDVRFSETDIKGWCFQVFRALDYIHQSGYIHRDLKPENLLITNSLVKVADLGLARETCSDTPCTVGVGTRWFQAPEILLRSSMYDSKVDMWAMGAIMAELFTRNPLFPGSSEADQISKICKVLGSPNQHSWPDGLRLAAELRYEFPRFPTVHLSRLIPSASFDAIDLITRLCSWDPRNRPSALQALQHPFFHSCFCIPPVLHPRVPAPAIPPGFGPVPNHRSRIPSTKTNDEYAKHPVIPKNPTMACVNATSCADGTDLAEELAQMILNSGQPHARQQQQALKAGCWNGDHLACSPSLTTGRFYQRKVVG